MQPDLKQEREHLLALVSGVEQHLDDGDRDGAVAALTALARHLRLHDREAEEALFPAVEKRGLGHDRRTLNGLRREHRAFYDLVRLIERGLLGGTRHGAHGDLRELEVSLRLHLAREEEVLAPRRRHA